MDWDAAVEKNHEALKRVLAMLVAMAGLGAGGQFTLFPQKRAAASGPAQPEKSKLSPALTLPRQLHTAILRLLRPAEAAVRRLIIVAARNLVVTRPQLREPQMKPLMRRRYRVAAPAEISAPRIPSLPLLDPLRPWRGPARPTARSVPRISVPGFSEPFAIAVRHPPSLNDEVNAAGLKLRLEVLASALDDLPRQAKRFARWRARRDAQVAADKSRFAAGVRDRQPLAAGRRAGPQHLTGRFQRIWPMRPGRPPGWRRRPVHEVDDILNAVHGLAFWALEPDPPSKVLTGSG